MKAGRLRTRPQAQSPGPSPRPHSSLSVMTASRRLSAHRAQARSRRPARQFTICVLDATPHADPQFQHLSWLDVTLQATTAGTTPCWSRAPNIVTVPRPPLLGTTEPGSACPPRGGRAHIGPDLRAKVSHPGRQGPPPYRRIWIVSRARRCSRSVRCSREVRVAAYAPRLSLGKLARPPSHQQRPVQRNHGRAHPACHLESIREAERQSKPRPLACRGER